LSKGWHQFLVAHRRLLQWLLIKYGLEIFYAPNFIFIISHNINSAAGGCYLPLGWRYQEVSSFSWMALAILSNAMAINSKLLDTLEMLSIIFIVWPSSGG
jgi:hypothetical protein